MADSLGLEWDGTVPEMKKKDNRAKSSQRKERKGSAKGHTSKCHNWTRRCPVCVSL